MVIEDMGCARIKNNQKELENLGRRKRQLHHRTKLVAWLYYLLP